eukprot:s73_g15.t1
MGTVAPTISRVQEQVLLEYWGPRNLQRADFKDLEFLPRLSLCPGPQDLAIMCLQRNTMVLPTNLPAELLADACSALPAKVEPTVEELLESSLRAVKEAPNRSVKRRLRQRLHKKLGALLTPEEYEEALGRMKSREEAVSGSESGDSGDQPTGSALRSQPMPVSSTDETVGALHWQPTPTMGPKQHARQMMKAMGHSISEAIDELEDAALAAWREGPLPVRHTFIHYCVGRSGSRNRSHSV